jgi:hypothetical protein
MYRSDNEEQEATEFGFYVDTIRYTLGFSGEHEYDGEAPKRFDFGYRLPAGGRTIEDAVIKVDGNKIASAHTVADGAVVGHGRLTDFTRKGHYVVDFTVTYEGGEEESARVYIRQKKPEKKDNTGKVQNAKADI